MRYSSQPGTDRHNEFVGIPANARLQQAFTGIHNKPLDSSFRWNDGVVGMTTGVPEVKQITMSLPPIFRASPPLTTNRVKHGRILAI